jgi:hypothetical protein
MDAKKLMEMMKAKKASLKQKAKTIKPNPGANRYIILPGWRKGDETTFWHDFGQHYVKNAAGEIQAVYPCLDKTYGNPCPICDGLSHAIKSTSDDATVALLKEAASGQSYLLNVLALDMDDDATPQILEIRKSAFGQVVDIIDEWGMAIFDPESPQIIVISREGKGLMTKYTAQVSPKKHPMPPGVLKKLNDLDDYVKQESEEQRHRALSAINNVAGLLPSADRPKSASYASSDASDEAEIEAAMNSGKTVSSGKARDVVIGDDLDDLLSDIEANG